jgi:formylglycine-generating enzyme required for sulfatase activity
MSDFWKKFLLEDPRRFSPSGRFVALAAFGKHPGWDDHVEDLGLETEALNVAKLVLYVNGIGGQIDSGAWEKLDSAQQLPGFKHVLVWQRSGQILVGRMWSSSDGKGRKRYPMVVCLHFAGVPLAWALKHALPALTELETGCTATTSAEEVRSLLARKRATLREALQSADGKGEYAPVMPEALHRILNPADPARVEGFLRVLYQIQSQLVGFAPGVFNLRASPASLRVQQIRVPALGNSPEETLLFWTRFFQVYVDSTVPLLLALPIEANWLDVTAGEPESHELFCLRATPRAVPMVSEVPYKLEEGFSSKGTAFLDSFRRGETQRPDLQPPTPPAVAAPAASGSGWLKWLGVGVVAVLGVVAALTLLPKGGSEMAATQPGTSASNSNDVAAADAAKAEQAKSRARLAEQAEAARLAEEKKKAESVAAAARLKAETEAAANERQRQLAEAAKEKERQVAEATAKEKERQIAAAKEKERQLAEAAALEKERAAAVAKEKERQLAESARLAAEQQAALKKPPEAQTAKPIEVAAVKTPPPETAPSTVPPASAPGTTVDGTVPTGVPTSGLMTNGVGMVMVLLPSGLWVGKYEVTQSEYNQVMKSNPSISINERQPVDNVSWGQAVEFTRRLTELERAKGTLPTGKIYSLPTGKQWIEFSAGQKFEDLPGGNLVRRQSPAVVGQSGPPNKYGLYDVLGNVWEWCLDDSPTGGQKLVKGGAFKGAALYEKDMHPDNPSATCGFRCVITAP